MLMIAVGPAHGRASSLRPAREPRHLAETVYWATAEEDEDIGVASTVTSQEVTPSDRLRIAASRRV